MEYNVCGNTVVLRLDKGEDIAEEILSVAKKENITAASVTGIGATDDFVVGVFDVEKKAYEEFTFSGNHEINALVGNLTFVDGKPYSHLHVTCTGKDGKVVGGHLIRAKISLTCEIFINVLNSTVSRRRNEALGINELSF